MPGKGTLQRIMASEAIYLIYFTSFLNFITASLSRKSFSKSFVVKHISKRATMPYSTLRKRL